MLLSRRRFLLAAAGTSVLGSALHAQGAPAPLTFLALGDSLTAAYGLERQEGWLFRIEARLAAAGRPWRVIDAGVSGDTTAGGRRRIAWLLRQPVDVFLVALGGNDALRALPPASTEENLDAILSAVRKSRPQARLVVAGMLAPPNLGPTYEAEFAAVFPRVAERHGATLIPFLLEGVAGDPALNQPDGIHPNVEGQKVMEAQLWKHLNPIFEAAEATRIG